VVGGKPIPGDGAMFEVNNWLFPWYDQKVFLKFKQAASKCLPLSGTQEAHALYLVKASGCGKTKLAFSLGLEEGFTVISIRLALQSKLCSVF
jgi:hypothetical protein